MTNLVKIEKIEQIFKFVIDKKNKLVNMIKLEKVAEATKNNLVYQAHNVATEVAKKTGLADFFLGFFGLSTEKVESVTNAITKAVAPKSSAEIQKELEDYVHKILRELFNFTEELEDVVDNTIQEIYNYYDDLSDEKRKEEKYGIEYNLYLLDHVMDYRKTYEYRYLEKLYFGETYAQYYNKHGDYEGGICLQNDWAHKIRSSCEGLNVKVNEYRLKGCQYPHINYPDRCGLRYNYNKHICEPTQNYCRAYGIGPIQYTPSNHQVELQLEKNGSKKI